MILRTVEFYVKNPKLIREIKDKDLLYSLVKMDSSLVKWMTIFDLETVDNFLKIDYSSFEYIDRSLFSYDYLKDVCARYPWVIEWVYMPNDELMSIALDASKFAVMDKIEPTQKLLKKYLVQDGLLLSKLETKYHTEELVRIAITQNPQAYKFSVIKNEELDLLVIGQDKNMIMFVSGFHRSLIPTYLEFPEYYQMLLNEDLDDKSINKILETKPYLISMIEKPTDEQLQTAIKTDPSIATKYHYDDSIIKELIPYNGMIIEHMHYKDIRTIMSAIKQNIDVLKLLKNPRLLLIDYAYSVSAMALQFLKTPTLTQCEQAVLRDPRAIEFVPKQFQTKSMQLSVLNQIHGDATQWIEPLDEEVLLVYLNYNPDYILSLDNPNTTYLKIAFTVKGNLILKYEDWETRFNVEVIDTALNQNGSLLQYVRKPTITNIETSINSYPAAIQWVYQTEELIFKALELDIRTLKYINRDKLTLKMLKYINSVDTSYLQTLTGEMSSEEWFGLKSSDDI